MVKWVSMESSRRRRRRQQIRRRRAAALFVLVMAIAAVGVACGAIRASGPTTAASTDADGAAATTAPEPPATTVAAAPATPKRLGSGEPVTFAFGGDVMFETPINGYLDDPSTILAGVAPALRSADIAMVNLETAVTDRGEPTANKEYNFRAPPSAYAALLRGGVDVVTVANNHGMDYGVVGLRDTLRHAKRAGMPVVGGGMNERAAFRPWRTTVNGQRIAIIGATQVIDEEFISWWAANGSQPGVASAKYEMEDRLALEVKRARATSDTVVVYLHWGEERNQCATASQQSIARRLVQAGADIVVGSHAHALLGAGMLGRAFVAYGLGNFVFYSTEGNAIRSGVLKVTATGRRIDGYRFVPAELRGTLPVIRTGDDRAAAAAEFRDLRACTNLER